MLSEAALARGLAGLVIHGGVRDSRQLVGAGWPVFAERVCIRGTGKDPNRAGALGVPVDIGGITVRRGDLIVGDADGVVRIPADRAAAVRAASGERDAAEARYIERLRDGETTLAVYGLP